MNISYKFDKNNKIMKQEIIKLYNEINRKSNSIKTQKYIVKNLKKEEDKLNIMLKNRKLQYLENLSKSSYKDWNFFIEEVLDDSMIDILKIHVTYNKESDNIKIRLEGINLFLSLIKDIKNVFYIDHILNMNNIYLIKSCIKNKIINILNSLNFYDITLFYENRDEYFKTYNGSLAIKKIKRDREELKNKIDKLNKQMKKLEERYNYLKIDE